MKLFVARACLLMLGMACAPVAGHALDNGLARTPPMGWNSWNKYACKGINEKVVRETADAMASNGMKDAGYQLSSSMTAGRPGGMRRATSSRMRSVSPQASRRWQITFMRRG
jgi:hypothetical protein